MSAPGPRRRRAGVRPPAGALARALDHPAGLSMAEAVEAADANLLSIRGQLLAEADSAAGRMLALGIGALREMEAEAEAAARPKEGRGGTAVAAASSEAVAATAASVALEEIHRLANSLIGVAGAAGLWPLAAACYSLCELVDRVQSSGRGDAPTLRVHLDCLKLLRPAAATASGALPPESQNAIAAALRRVAARA